MRLHSENMKPFQKTCSNCFHKFEQPCSKNNKGKCLKKQKHRFWRDYYDLCNGCKRQNTQTEDYSICCVCRHISKTHSRDYYKKFL